MTRWNWGRFLCLFVAVSLVVPSVSMGFNRLTRKSIIDDAISLCPEKLKVYLEEDAEAIYMGMTFDYDNHAQIDPRSIPHVYDGLVERLKSGQADAANTIRAFGSLAALVSEAIYPGYRKSTEDIDPSVIAFDGINQIGDPVLKTKALMDSYSPYWQDNRPRVQESMYGVAVNETVDFWVSAWKASGRDPGPAPDFGKEIHRKELRLTTGVATDEDKKAVAAKSAAQAVAIPEGWIAREKKRLKSDLGRYEEDFAAAKNTAGADLASFEKEIAALKAQLQELNLDPEAYYKKKTQH